MSTAVPTAEAIEAQLRRAIAPTALQVIDESAAHAGHSLAHALDEVAPMGFDFVQWLPGDIQQGWVLGFAESDPSSTT